MACPITYSEDYSSYDQEVYSTLLEHKSRFNITVRAQGYPVTNQKDLNICWIHVGCGICRLQTSEILATPFLELSQDYLYYYYWMFRIEYFFEKVKSCTILPEIQNILGERFPDEGSIEYFLHLVRNVGIVPKAVYQFLPHTVAERTSFFSNLKTYLFKSGVAIRLLIEMFADQDTNESITETFKLTSMQKLGNFLGVPPIQPNEYFKYKYQELNGAVRINAYTPLEFMKKLCPCIVSSYTVIKKCVGQLDQDFYAENTIKYNPNSAPVSYLNLNLDILALLTVHSLSENVAVYAAFELDPNLDFTQDILEDVKTKISTKPCTRHAMLITCASTGERKDEILNFRVENSIGRGYGVEGHHTMPIQFFKKSVFEVAIPSGIVNSFFQKNDFILTQTALNL